MRTGDVTSLGCRVEDVWSRICNGQSGVRPLQRFDAAAYRVRFGGEVRFRLVHGRLHRPARDEAAGPLHPVRHGRRHRRGPRLGHRLLQGRAVPLRRHGRLGDRRSERDRGPAHPPAGKGPGKGLRLHHPQADRQRGQRAAFDSIRACAAPTPRWSRPAQPPPTPSATPSAPSNTTTPR